MKHAKKKSSASHPKGRDSKGQEIKGLQTDPRLVDELEDLLEQVIIQEASQAVWQQFEQALYQLDKQSLDILESYLDGVPPESLGKANKISPKEAGDLIAQIKRDVTRHLKKGSPVRH